MRSGAITLSPNVIWSGWCIFDIQIGSSFHDERYDDRFRTKAGFRVGASFWLLGLCKNRVRLEAEILHPFSLLDNPTTLLVGLREGCFGTARSALSAVG